MLALRYATRSARRPGNFLGGDPHDAEMPLDYYFWAIRGGGRLILVDAGFNEDMAGARGRTLLRRPVDALKLIGVAAEDVREIVITHLHNDHAGAASDFPNARFHLQDDEMSYATGRCMCHARLRHSYELGHVTHMVSMVFGDRVIFHKGEAEIAPGVSVHQIPGHSPGMQAVRVRTARGWVALASDASHFYEHFETGRCFPCHRRRGGHAGGLQDAARPGRQRRPHHTRPRSARHGALYAGRARPRGDRGPARPGAHRLGSGLR